MQHTVFCGHGETLLLTFMINKYDLEKTACPPYTGYILHHTKHFESATINVSITDMDHMIWVPLRAILSSAAESCWVVVTKKNKSLHNINYSKSDL